MIPFILSILHRYSNALRQDILAGTLDQKSPVFSNLKNQPKRLDLLSINVPLTKKQTLNLYQIHCKVMLSQYQQRLHQETIGNNYFDDY